MIWTAWFILVAAFLLNGCGESRSDDQSNAQKAAASLTGDETLAAASNPLCKMFTRAEVAKYIGEPVSAGRNAGMGAGCQWVATDDSGDVLVMVVPSRYHERPSLAKGFSEVADLGTRGFVVPELDGWGAGAIQGNDAIRVSVAGGSASETSAVALLKEALARRAR